MGQEVNALTNILKELRIDFHCLTMMAEGKSPDIAAHGHAANTIAVLDNNEEYNYSFPKVQLSKDTAKQVLDLIKRNDEIEFY